MAETFTVGSKTVVTKLVSVWSVTGAARTRLVIAQQPKLVGQV
jgi:hypothetical protein